METERRCYILFLDAIEKYGVYEDEALRNLVANLERKYIIKDEIEFFSQLVNFSKNKDIPYHCWFKYREGFSHTLIKELLIRSNIEKNEYVLDPFCGSGTTVVEAALNGYSGIGIDINPMSAFISEVKCRAYADEEIEFIENNIELLLEEATSKSACVDYLEKYKEVKKFFNPEKYERLLAIREVLDSKKDKIGIKIYEFFLCAYICIIEAVSDRKRDGNGLKTVVSKVENVEEFYIQQIRLMLNDIKKYRITDDVISILDYGNAMKLSDTVAYYSEKMGRSLGVIMYSPPYANSFDYFESYKMEVILADYAKDMKDIGSYRKQAIESFVGRSDERTETRSIIELMADEIERAIPIKEALSGRRDARTRKVPKMIKGYFADMEKVIAESSKVLTHGKKSYIVVDQSAYLGRIVPTDLFLAAIAEDYDFKVNEIIVCRNAKTSAQQIQKYPYLSDSLRESIVVLEKI